LSLTGGLPVMSQPLAIARSARSTPLCVTATIGVRVSSAASQRRRRATTSRGLSPPGGRKSSPRRSLAMNASP
jgi:hypothetical protein